MRKSPAKFQEICQAGAEVILGPPIKAFSIKNKKQTVQLQNAQRRNCKQVTQYVLLCTGRRPFVDRLA